MKNIIKTSLLMIAIFTLLLGIIYPLFITGVAQLAFNRKANGGLIELNGNIVGSENIGQVFTNKKYFHTRPSSIDYNAALSGAFNYGPMNEKLTNDIEKRITDFRALNELDSNVTIPSDIVTASSSGLDPNISLEAAYLQVKRIAKERQMLPDEIKTIIDSNMENQILSQHKMVNVLKLNILLDEMKK